MPPNNTAAESVTRDALRRDFLDLGISVAAEVSGTRERQRKFVVIAPINDGEWWIYCYEVSEHLIDEVSMEALSREQLQAFDCRTATSIEETLDIAGSLAGGFTQFVHVALSDAPHPW